MEERAEKLNRIAALSEVTKAENRNWTADELSEFNTLETEVRALNTEKVTFEAQERASLHAASSVAGASVQGKVSDKDAKDISKYSLRKALLSLTDRNSRLEGIELEMHQEADAEMRAFGKSVSGAGIAIPTIAMGSIYQKRDITVATGNGSFTVEDGVLGYVEALREKSLALQLGAEYLAGLTGNFDMSRENAVYTPSFKTENGTATETNPTYARAVFSPKRLTGFIDVSKQLLIQSAVGIEARLRNQLLLGHAEALDKVAFNGSSASDEPVGILNDANVGILAIGTNGGAITKVLTEQLVQALEEAKGMTDNTVWVVSPILKRILKNLSKDSGSGQYVWMNNSIDGIAAYATTHVPKNIAKGEGTNLTAAILADFSNMMYGQWGGTEIIVDPYTQALSGLVRFIPCQYVDFNTIQPGRVQVIKDITTS